MSAPFNFTEMLATYRYACEEWGAGNGDAWLDRLREAEDALQTAWSEMAARVEEMHRHMPYEG